MKDFLQKVLKSFFSGVFYIRETYRNVGMTNRFSVLRRTFLHLYFFTIILLT